MAFVSQDTLNRALYSHTLYTRVTIMTFDFITTDEITGVVIGNPSFTNDATSDVRRTMTIELYPTDSTFDIVNGSKVWMDKYVKVELGVKGDMEQRPFVQGLQDSSVLPALRHAAVFRRSFAGL